MTTTLPTAGPLPGAVAVTVEPPAGPGDGSLSADYLRQVRHRLREPMVPLDFAPNWDDQPSRHVVYEGAVRVPLPPPFSGPTGTLAAALATVAGDRGQGRGLSWPVLSTLLGCYGICTRRLDLTWNDDSRSRAHADRAVWGRPTASGGGMYPVETFLVAGPGAPLLPGVYHYSTAHHALDRLLVGDRTDAVRASLGGLPAAEGADVFLLAAIDFWKNSFKYNSFSYHVVTQDLGALLASWRLVLGAAGAAPPAVLWFDEAPLDALLGLDGESRAVFAAVPLRWEGGGSRPAAIPPPRSRAAVTAQPWQRSRTVVRFPLVPEVHRAGLVGPAPRPAPPAPVRVTEPAGQPAGQPAGDPDGAIALPPPHSLDRAPLGEVLTERRSSFGRFAAVRPMAGAAVADVLAAAAAVRHAPTDLAPAAHRPPWTGLWLLANRVDGVPPGAYRYDASGHRLLPAPPGPDEPDLGSFLQRNYALTNYNMREVAAVLVITGAVGPALRCYGDRGYRVLNAEVGSVAQTAYLAATAAGVGCGAVLGLDNVAVDGLLGLDDDAERSLLFVLLGNERTGHAEFRAGVWEGDR